MAKYGRSVDLSITYHQVLADAVRPKLEKLAETIESDAKRLVPIDTGSLRDTIEVHVEKNGDIVGNAGNPDFIGPLPEGVNRVDYAAYVEFGTHATKKRPWTTPEQPYMRPAFYENRGEL